MANIATINERIETIRASERVTKNELATISRELLEYLAMDRSNDIDAVNRLFGALTPMNLKTAGMFFSHFLPWKFDSEAVSFGKRFKGEKAVEKAFDKCVEALADPNFNIWTWAADNVKIEKKKPDYLSAITKNVKKAIEEDHIPLADIVGAVMAGGVEVGELVNLIAEAAANAQHDEKKEEENKEEVEERLAA